MLNFCDIVFFIGAIVNPCRFALLRVAYCLLRHHPISDLLRLEHSSLKIFEEDEYAGDAQECREVS